MDIFYVVGPHLPFEHLFSVWETYLPKVEVRHLLSQPPLQLEISVHECDLIFNNQICHVRFYCDRDA